MKANKSSVFAAGISLGIDVMRKELPEPLKKVEAGVITACREIGLDPEYEINGLSFVGRVLVRVIEGQTGETLIPENEEDASHLVFCTKLAAFADKFGTERAAAEYNLPVGEVDTICKSVWAFQDCVSGLTWGENQKAH